MTLVYHLRCLVYITGVKVISNGGGVNPQACSAAIRKVCQEQNVHLNIATVTGDDLMPQVLTSNCISNT